MLPLVGAIAQGRAGPRSAWVLAPLLHWLGFSAARITEAKVSENVSSDFFSVNEVICWWKNAVSEDQNLQKLFYEEFHWSSAHSLVNL